VIASSGSVQNETQILELNHFGRPGTFRVVVDTILFLSKTVPMLVSAKGSKFKPLLSTSLSQILASIGIAWRDQPLLPDRWEG
jgi:hypothetical protein